MSTRLSSSPARVLQARRMPAAAFAALALLVVGVATLTPTSGNPGSIDFWCIACGEVGATDVVANVALFLPLGFALAMFTGRVRTAAIACVAVTIVIELLQIKVVAGRDASSSDILANSLGGWIGALAASHWRTFVHPGPVAARRLAVIGATALGGILTLTAAALMPAPVPAKLWIQWAPPRAGYDQFSGELLGLDVNGIVIRPVYPVDAPGLDRALNQRSWRASALVATDALQPGRAVIARIADESSVIVSLEQLGRDLACRQKTRSGTFRFQSPKVLLRDALAEGRQSDGRTLRLICGREANALLAGVAGIEGERHRGVALSPSLGWYLISPFGLALDERFRIVSALWLVAVAFPVGYWTAARHARRAHRSTPGAMHTLWRYVPILIALVLGLVVAPLVTRTAVAAWWEWLASVCGVALGGFGFAALAKGGAVNTEPEREARSRAVRV